MPLNIYSTAVLNRVVRELDKSQSFLLDMFYPEVQESEDEFIYFDVERIRPRITPLVAAHMPGKVVEEEGYTTHSFRPAYAKDKRPLRPKGALKRAIGEAIGGNLSPAERQRRRLLQSMQNQLDMLTRREEVMASEGLRTGKVTVSGEGYATQIVDFGRESTFTFTLTNNDRWTINHADSNPMEDLETWAAMPTSKGGGAITDYVMSPDAWRAARKRLIERDEARTLLDFQRSGNSAVEMGPLAYGPSTKARRVGQVGTFTIWTYDDVYEDDAGVEQHMMPSGTVIGGSRDVEGTRAYGVIEDEEANFSSSRYFAKSWLEHDPSLRWLLLQSAPLMVPYRPNATVCATVF